MFAKLLSIALVFIVCCFNILYILTPFIAILIPFIDFNSGVLVVSRILFNNVFSLFIVTLFSLTFLMLFYMLLDFLFGFSARQSLKNCKKFEKYKQYDFLQPVMMQVKEKFQDNSIQLYIRNSDEINAFAVGSLSGKYIVISRGLIDHFFVCCPEPKTFLSAIRAVISHEMSHLINKDYVPGYLILTNQKITNLVSKFLHFFFVNFARLLSFIPYGGNQTAGFMYRSYLFIDIVVGFFNRVIVFNIYEFVRKFLSRSIEYRCDLQASKAFGGKNVALALTLLGEDSYFSLFSTHPKTKSRIKWVENIKISDKVIRPYFIDSLANYLAFMILIFFTLLFAKLSKFDLLIREIIRNHETIHRKLHFLWDLITKIY
ncbi:MAG: M48 family metalloprotease [Rickettsiales bacterium]